MTEAVSPRVLGWIAAALGAIAPLAGSPYIGAHGRVDVEQLASAVAREEDHVTALELAQWIKDRRPDLRVVDVRTRADFDAFHLPTAEHIPIESIATASFDANDTIVLYSDGGAHAAQAWVFLRALGHQQVFFLRGGLIDWIDDVLNPAIAPDATADAKAAFARIAALSRYFGGTPRLVDGAEPPDDPAAGAAAPRSTASAVAKIRKRRC